MKKIAIFLVFVVFSLTAMAADSPKEKAISAQPCGDKGDWCVVLEKTIAEKGDFFISTDPRGQLVAQPSVIKPVKKIRVDFQADLKEWDLTPAEAVLKAYNSQSGQKLERKPEKLSLQGIRLLTVEKILRVVKTEQKMMVIEEDVKTEGTVDVILFILFFLLLAGFFVGVAIKTWDVLSVNVAPLLSATFAVIATTTATIVIIPAPGIPFACVGTAYLFAVFTGIISDKVPFTFSLVSQMLIFISITLIGDFAAVGIFAAVVVVSFLLGRFIPLRRDVPTT